MDEFVDELRGRVRAARKALDQAVADDDGYGVTVYSGELDSLLRKAMEHGIEIDAGREG